jgi:basic membrane protein A
MFIRSFLAVVLMALVLPFSTAYAQLKIEKPKPAFILFGPISEGGWTFAQDRAREKMSDKLGENVPYVENVQVTNEAVGNVIDLYISRGYNLIVGGTYGFSDPFLTAAKAHSNLAFVNIAGVTSADNLESFYAKTFEGWYLAGMAAGSATKSGTIGIIAGFPMPYVLWDVNAFARGAQSVKPGVKTIVTFVNSWSDPVKETQLAQSIIEQGADVVATAMDSTSVPVAAEKAGVYSIGYQNDLSAVAPKGMLMSVVFDWSARLNPILDELKAGTWKSEGKPLFGIKSGIIDITPMSHAVPAEAVSKIAKVRQSIVDGSFTPYDGPVVAQNGTVKCAEGCRMTLDDLWKTDFLVQGVQGTTK